MDSIENFKKEVEENIIKQGKDQDIKEAAKAFMISSIRSRYSLTSPG